MSVYEGPTVTPALLMAEGSCEVCRRDMNRKVWTDDDDELFWSEGDTRVEAIQAVHFTRAEVVGELERIAKKYRKEFTHTDYIDEYVAALRASLDDPEEGSA